MATRTGGFPIGFRRRGSDWQKRDLGALAGWAKQNGFDSIDLERVTAEDARTLEAAGLRLGSVDLDTSDLLDNDPGKRRAAVARAIDDVNRR